MHLIIVLIAAAIVGATPIFAQENGGLTPEFTKCMDRADDEDSAMNDCIGEESVRQDKRLNEAYKKLMSALPPERQKQLREAQRLWIKYTDANCDFYMDPEGGSAARISANSCLMNARSSRAKELEDILAPLR